MVRNGLNRMGLARGKEHGGGEAKVELEWKEVDRGDMGDEADDPGESQTLINGDPASEVLGSPGSVGSILTRGGWCLVTSMSRMCDVCHECDVCGTKVFTRLEDVTEQPSPSVSIPSARSALIGRAARRCRPMRAQLLLLMCLRPGDSRVLARVTGHQACPRN